MHSSTVRYFDNCRHSEQDNACALRDEMADEQRENLAHAIVYPTKTKPAGLPKNNRRLVTTQSSLTATATVIKASKEESAMQGSTTDRTSTGYVATHPLDPEDAAITAAMRAMVSPSKGVRPGIEARGQFYALMESVLPRDDVTFEADTLGGVPGLWVQPADWRSSETIVHLHGGWFNFGSAKAYRHLVGHVAARAGARAFIPDYRLAPEHPIITDQRISLY